jgi:hypothetical protein
LGEDEVEYLPNRVVDEDVDGKGDAITEGSKEEVDNELE